FHLMTAEMTGSQRLTKYINEIETCLLIVRKNLKNSSRKEEVVDLSWLLHKNIVKAMELKDKGLLQELNREHIKLMKDTQLI
ncbi:FCD domain-containing protein, partial [Eisenbergiella massiliensis]|uniref:FCD domain-containing protein n=2 Tax=Bacillota TaxID=1239 RepID=UPI0023F267C0